VPQPALAVPTVVRADTVIFEPLGIAGAVRAETGTAVGPDRSQTIGCGFARFEDCAFPWTLAYDEAVYVIDGSMQVGFGSTVLSACAGDAVFVPRGSAVEYRFHGSCLLFYVTYPVDWAIAQSTAEQQAGSGTWRAAESEAGAGT
jgi:ethanolamine utilization protein EutQ